MMDVHGNTIWSYDSSETLSLYMIYFLFVDGFLDGACQKTCEDGSPVIPQLVYKRYACCGDLGTFKGTQKLNSRSFLPVAQGSSLVLHWIGAL